LSNEFSVTITAPCVYDDYTFTRSGIKELPLYEKYVIALDTDLLLPFTFDYTPATCTSFKHYEFKVETRPSGGIAGVSVDFTT
jgi:hypothetical protein